MLIPLKIKILFVLQYETLEGHPTAPPQNLEAVAHNSTTLYVSWRPPNSQNLNGRNRGYKIIYKVKAATDSPLTVTLAHNMSNPIGTQDIYLAR